MSLDDDAERQVSNSLARLALEHAENFARHLTGDEPLSLEPKADAR